MTLPVALCLSGGLLCGWIPSLLHLPISRTIPTLVLMLLNSVILMSLMVQTGVTRDRDGLPIFMYVLLATAFPILHTMWQGQFSVLILLLVLRILHQAFRQKDATEDSLTITLLLLFGSLWIPDMVWLIPLVWLAYLFLHALNVRVLLASLIGVAVFGIYLSLTIYMGWMDNPYTSLFSYEWIGYGMDLPNVIEIFGLVGLGVYFLVASLVRMANDSTARRTLWVLLLLFFVANAGFALCTVSPISSVSMLLPTVVGGSVLFFRQHESMARGIMFVVFLALLASVYTLHFMYYMYA